MRSFIKFFLLFSFLFSSHARAVEVKFYVEDADNIPFSMKGDRGLAFIIMKMVAKKVPEAHFSYTYVPWERALSSMAGNQADGIFPASFKSERLSMGAYPMKGGKPDDSRRVVLASYSLFVRAQDAAKTKVDGFKITGIDKVTAVIGGNKGYSIMDDLAKEGYKTDPVLRTEQNIAKLAGSRLTAVADITDSASKIINQPEYKGRIVQLEPPIVVKPQYVMFSHQFEKDHAALVEKIWASIVEVRESAEYKAEAEAFLKSL